jgi:hypothetical protein
MPRVRPACAAVGAVLAALLAGCYGSTEPATDVGEATATLHAKGTTNNGPAQSFFEYWPTADPGRKSTTSPHDWPGGVSGRFSQPVSELSQGTKYTFRMCGNDEGQAPVCAQNRTFETQAPDTASGSGANANSRGGLNASSGPSGEHPAGTMSLISTDGQRGFQGNVSCLKVSGNVARVAATGKPFVGGTVGPFVTIYAKVVAGSSGQGTFDFEPGELSATPNCGAYDGGGEVLTGDFSVTDSQPPEPPS